MKLGENLSWDFEVIYIFGKNAVLNICRYLKGFYIYKKSMYYAKNHGNRLNLSF